MSERSISYHAILLLFCNLWRLDYDKLNKSLFFMVFVKYYFRTTAAWALYASTFLSLARLKHCRWINKLNAVVNLR